MKPILINNLELAKTHAKFSGEYALREFNRLAELLPEQQLSDEMVQYSLLGTGGELPLPSMRLKLDVQLPATCQRCMQAMQLDVSLDFSYVISVAEPEPFDGDEEVDWLETDEEMDLLALIEDELLMAYPVGPLHDYDCQPEAYAMVEDETSQDTHQPFAGLKDLIDKKQ